MRSCKWFPRVTKFPTRTYSWIIRIVVSNAFYKILVLNFMYSIYILCDIEVVIYVIIMLILWKRVDGFDHHLNIRYYRRSSEDNCQPWTKIYLPISSFVICTQGSAYYSTRCWYLTNIKIAKLLKTAYWLVACFVVVDNL